MINNVYLLAVMETHVDQTFMGPVPHQCTVGQGDRNIQRFVSPCVTAARVARLRHISPPNLNPGWTGKPSPIWQPGPAAPTRSAADWTREPMTHRHWQEGEVKPRSRILSSCWVARLGGKSGPIWQPCDCALTLFLLLLFFIEGIFFHSFLCHLSVSILTHGVLR